jgi:hypothetical protein
MQGFREFSTIDYNSGTVSVSYLNESGLLKFRYDQIVSIYMGQLGRLYALDISPTARRKGVSLDGMRKASVAQVVLDSALPQDKINKFKLDLMPALLMYGTVGVGLWYEGEDEQGLELIPPWQLFPIPINVSGPNEVRGLVRVRPVPVSWIKGLTITGGKKKTGKIEDVDVPAGHLPADLDTMGQGVVSMTSAGGGFFVRSDPMNNTDKMGGRTKKKDEKNVPVTQLVEVWTETSNGYLADYCVYAGMARLTELYRHDHSENKYHMPTRVIRDTPVGSFWGRSYIDQLIPLNHELELALSSVFQAVADFDLYGMQLWPNTLGVPPMAERGQDGIKRIRYEPDYTCPEQKPENVMPAKMTAPQMQAVQLAAGLMDKQANQPNEMLGGGAPGRVDSSAGLGFLYEVSGIPLSPTAKNIAEGMSGVYRATLRVLKDRWSNQKVVSISNLDDSLAGIVLDVESGGMHLDLNAIPSPDEVSITVASEVPVSKEMQKQELKEALKEQRITLHEFNCMVRKQGLDIPVGDQIGWQNHRRAMLENILLFRDGKTPGKVVTSPRDNHQIHYDSLLAFMAKPEFFAASPEVMEAFEEHLKEHQAGLGTYPDQLPFPEDIAAATLGQGEDIGMTPPEGGFPTQ